MKEKLEWIESQLKELFEEKIPFIKNKHKFSSQQLAHQLANDYQSLIIKEGLELSVPARLVVLLPTVDIEYWERDAQFLQELTLLLVEFSYESGLNTPSPPLLTIRSSQDLSTGEIRLIAYNQNKVDPTQSITPPNHLNPYRNSPYMDACLINEKGQKYPLKGSIIQIGRHTDNQIAIDDQRISRFHAQIRLKEDKHIIIDLDSTGGTTVNDCEITQSALRDHDRISLGGYQLYYQCNPTPETAHR